MIGHANNHTNKQTIEMTASSMQCYPKIMFSLHLRIRRFSFIKTLRKKPEGVPRRLRIVFLCLVIRRFLCGTPLGFCLRAIVNEKSQNVKKDGFNVLSVILIYLWFRRIFHISSGLFDSQCAGILHVCD